MKIAILLLCIVALQAKDKDKPADPPEIPISLQRDFWHIAANFNPIQMQYEIEKAKMVEVQAKLAALCGAKHTPQWSGPVVKCVLKPEAAPAPVKGTP